MRIECIHGYFKFHEESPGQISEFISQFGLEIERSEDHFTFSDLVDAPDFSLPGGTFLGCPTSVAFEGTPWEVMRENEIVYDFSKGLVVPLASIVQPVSILTAGNLFISPGMILPGSLMDDGTRVTDYAAFFKRGRFEYSEVQGE